MCIRDSECALAFAAQILYFMRILLGKAGEKRVEVGADGRSVGDKGVIGYVGCYGAEEEGAGWVAHPGVELACERTLAGRQHQFDGGRTIGFVRTKFGVAEVVACGLGFLAERHEVRRVG